MAKEPSDRVFENALRAGDESALTAEICLRLDSLLYGTGIFFRCDWGEPIVWRGTSRGSGSHHHAGMAKEAATALILSRGGEVLGG